MNRIIWLFAGLLLGAGGMWAYATQVREPNIVAQTTQSVKEMIEVDRIASSNELRGSVTNADSETNTFVIQATINGELKTITVTTDERTKFYRLATESNDGREQIGSSLITEGADVLIIINPTGSDSSVNAAEIILLS